MSPNRSRSPQSTGLSRLHVVAWGLVFVGIVVVARLFYIQIVKGSEYKQLAATEHNKKFEIPARRGEILARDGSEEVPLVLNEPAYTVFADPRYVDDVQEYASELSGVLGVDTSDLEKKLEVEGAYSVLARRVSSDTAKSVAKLKLKGIGTTEGTKRVYPEGNLAAHTLGFVNDDGVGQYGIEQALDKQISGTPGQLNGATDVSGIPIATEGSVLNNPVNGDDVILSIERSIQTQAEFFLKEGVENTDADSGSIVIMNPNNGQVLAMSNYPTFDPDQYSSQEDVNIFQNTVVSGAYEPGSVAKIFTMSTALNRGAVAPDTTYLDQSVRVIDGYKIKNVGTPLTKERTMTEVITRSANTGTIFALEQMGGGSITTDAKKILFDSFTGTFHFGAPTGVEQTGESAGYLEPPETASDVRYANMSFGQGVSMTMIQLASALSAIANGGTYYQPTLVDSYRSQDGDVTENQPVVVAEEILLPQTITQIKEMMKTVVTVGSGFAANLPGYDIAGKTGTAEIAKPDGGYYEDREIGSFFGFTPVDNPEYVIMVRVDNPKQPGVYASQAAVGVFANINKWLVNYYGVPPAR